MKDAIHPYYRVIAISDDDRVLHERVVFDETKARIYKRHLLEHYARNMVVKVVCIYVGEVRDV